MRTGTKAYLQQEPETQAAEIQRLKILTSDWHHVATGLACAAMQRQEIKLSLGKGWQDQAGGAERTLLPVRTNCSDARLVIMTDAGAAAYGTDGNPDRPVMLNVMSGVDGCTIRSMMALSEQALTPYAAHMMLGQLGISTDRLNVSPFSLVLHEGHYISRWIILAPGTTMMLVSTPKGSVLRQLGIRVVERARVTIDQVQEYCELSAVTVAKPLVA